MAKRKFGDPEPYDALLERKTLEYLRDDGKWPCWPLLPLKHVTLKEPNSAMGKLAVVVAAEPATPITVYEGDMYTFQKTDNPKVYATYDTPEALVADGWRIN